MATLTSTLAAKLFSPLYHASALVMDARIAVAESKVPDLDALIASLYLAAGSIKAFEPQAPEEFHRLSNHALEVAEQVQSLVADYPILSDAYEVFASEAEDLALGAQFEPSKDRSGARSLNDFR